MAYLTIKKTARPQSLLLELFVQRAVCKHIIENKWAIAVASLLNHRHQKDLILTRKKNDWTVA